MTESARAILVLNAGSSSIKFGLYGLTGETDFLRLARGQIEGLGSSPHFEAVDPETGEALGERRWDGEMPDREALLGELIAWIGEHFPQAELVAAGHRVVHGGEGYAAPVLIDEAILDALERLVPLAPLHQPHNLAPIRALRQLHPRLPQIACFDTAFHRSNGRIAQLYALPRDLIDEGVLRYGFHGLSYEFISGALPEIDGKAARGRTVVAHLGNGASLCALRNGESVASTMGFTALEGLPMGTRTGSLDPGIVLYLFQEKGLAASDVERLLYKESGLKGVSGISHDMRVLLESVDPHAEEAVDLFCYRVAREIGSLAVALGGLDALVFTAGIGEHAAPVRARIAGYLKWMGLVLDENANAVHRQKLHAPQSSISAYVIPTNEEITIARHTRALLERSASGEP